jgi:hypothetical protein
MNPPTTLPPSLQARLDRLVSELAPLVPIRVVALALYGGLAKGKALTDTSDVNLLLVVADSSAETLKAVAGPLTAARREARAAALIATGDELAAMSRSFALKYEDIRRHHKLLLGADPFTGKAPSTDDLRRDARRGLLNLSLRLKRLFVERAGDRSLHLAGLEDILPGAILDFKAALDPASVAMVLHREVILEDAAKKAGTRPDRLLALLAHKKGSALPGGMEPVDLAAELAATAEKLRRGLEAA